MQIKVEYYNEMQVSYSRCVDKQKLKTNIYFKSVFFFYYHSLLYRKTRIIHMKH